MRERSKALLGLVEGLEHACCRYRLRAFAPHLTRCGWDLAVRPLPPLLRGRLRALGAARGAEAVILQRKLLDILQLRYLRRRSRRLVFDFDDSVFRRDSFAETPTRSRLERRFRNLVRAADAIIAGNSFLAARAARHAGSSRVVVIPTCIEPQDYLRIEERPPREEGRLVLVWIGSGSTLKALEQGTALLQTIARAFPGLVLKVICDRPPRLPGIRTILVPWAPEREAGDLASADAGVSILPDDDWTRGKCGLKVLQYMAAGLPVLASPVGVHREMVEEGKSGFLPVTAGEWIDSLRALSRDPALASAMGRRGRSIVEERYSVSRWAPALEDALRG